MKTILFTLIAAGFIIALNSCAVVPDNGFVNFRINVDSTSYPENILIGDTLIIKLYGTVGTDGCSQFSNFESAEEPLKLDLTIWGKREDQAACPAVMVYLNGLEYKTISGKVGVYKINIHQPDGSILRDSVIVNPWGV